MKPQFNWYKHERQETWLDRRTDMRHCSERKGVQAWHDEDVTTPAKFHEAKVRPLLLKGEVR
jgi:hypothetical protein